MVRFLGRSSIAQEQELFRLGETLQNVSKLPHSGTVGDTVTSVEFRRGATPRLGVTKASVNVGANALSGFAALVSKPDLLAVYPQGTLFRVDYFADGSGVNSVIGREDDVVEISATSDLHQQGFNIWALFRDSNQPPNMELVAKLASPDLLVQAADFAVRMTHDSVKRSY